MMGWICTPKDSNTQLLENNATNIENMDDLRVEELNQLSQEARERAQEEVHCVVDELIEEEPDFVERRLAQLDDMITKTRKKVAYDRALFLSPSYVKDRDFALMFLRSADFNPRKASECMIAHFELKLELFGLACLARAITLDDLNQEDIVTLEAGNCQYLSEKDRGGRAVFCGLYKIKKNIAHHRVNFYQTMVALEDVETQKRGIVTVLFHYHYDGYDRMERLTKSLNFIRGLPWKFRGVHYCCSVEDMPFLLPIQNLAQYAIGSDGRRHFRAHRGSNMEIKFELLSFGIPMDNFPVDDDSELFLGLTDYCERRRSIENDRRAEQGSRILAPGKLDILLGRGKPVQEWVGNLGLASILVAKADLHNSTAMNRRGAKNELCDKIVRLLKESGGKFLKREDGALEWIEVDDTLAREKVCHGFRNQKLSLSKTSSGQTRKAGSEMGGSCVVPSETLSVADPPNDHGGGKRLKKYGAPTIDTELVGNVDQSLLEV